MAETLDVVLPEPATHSQPDGLKVFRAQSQEEILAIRDIALEFHNESRHAHIPYSEKTFIRQFSKAITNPHNTLALYVQYRGETGGLLAAGTGGYYADEGEQLVTIYVLCVSGEIRGSFFGGKIGLRLIRIASDWAKAQTAEELHTHSTSGIHPERTANSSAVGA